MTQLEYSRQGKITEAMRQAADREGCTPETVAERVAQGVAVIPINKARRFPARVIGQGFSTKVNANLGTSLSRNNLDEEKEKLNAALEAGADAVMDLSTGGDLHEILKTVLEISPVMVGTVPVYGVASRLSAAGKSPSDFTADELFEEIEIQAKLGVDFITVHCGVTQRAMETLAGCGRIMGMVSRGGSLMAEWMQVRGQENPLYAHYDRLLEIAREHDVTLSLGDGLRPGAIHDAEDRAQILELLTLGDLARRARNAGVQVMIEGPGHVPLSRIQADVKMQKRLCDGAPYYVLGPLPTDVAPGWDHLVGAIGGAIAAAAGVDFLCYVTPAEHLCLPTAKDVSDGVYASRIAAHIGDLEKGVPGAMQWDLDMAKARRAFDWSSMFRLALDSETARGRRAGSEDRDRDVCSMCGDMCALKTYERALGCGKKQEG
ncbi:MAG: phosphomethylpyrimidine synthase ThiC [Proteobacteria bacterium]|nr:phosphomethylpyrimidine synthase ThiC [Pseudomonadota bacterium]